ncbi:uncharacterized protein LOC129098956 [Anoplopoma fimbria]|uniref:uncharacterized protein LOC129098956 n=1 Tax=Anoplopoma fimbria TaxID=229290 RepID=UPI0023EB1D1F|nr:uncharacterized protein LOC129098956 [Anoplopoma fimbria]
MSAVYLKLMTILCLSCTALSGPGSSGVLWKDVGEAVTIQCRPDAKDQEYLRLEKGLSNDQIYFTDGTPGKKTISTKFQGRLQLHGDFPNITILIKNLTTEDTGPYYCMYSKFDPKSAQAVDRRGLGSVLLVVTDTATDTAEEQQCDVNLIMVAVVICGAALLVITICILIWLILKITTKKPRRVPNNDVYEDMRGTIRRDRRET